MRLVLTSRRSVGAVLPEGHSRVDELSTPHWKIPRCREWDIWKLSRKMKGFYIQTTMRLLEAEDGWSGLIEAAQREIPRGGHAHSGHEIPCPKLS